MCGRSKTCYCIGCRRGHSRKRGNKVGQEDGCAKRRDGSVYERARRCERGAENAWRGLPTGCWAPLRRLKRGPMALSAASRYATDRSSPLPAPGSTAATPALRHRRWWVELSTGAGVSWHGATQSCASPGTGPTAPASRLRPGTTCSLDARLPPPADGGRGEALRQTRSGWSSPTLPRPVR
jgi:hypothetical protein